MHGRVVQANRTLGCIPLSPSVVREVFDASSTITLHKIASPGRRIVALTVKGYR